MSVCPIPYIHDHSIAAFITIVLATMVMGPHYVIAVPRFLPVRFCGCGILPARCTKP
jgi:hypothetical protein